MSGLRVIVSGQLVQWRYFQHFQLSRHGSLYTISGSVLGREAVQVRVRADVRGVEAAVRVLHPCSWKLELICE